MSEAERVLIFIDHYLPGYKAGGPVRSCANMIEHLKDCYDFFVVTRDREYLEEEPYPEVERDAWNERPGYQVFYASADSLDKAGIQRRIQEVRPDSIYINGVYSYRFSILPLWTIKKLSSRPRTVIAPRGMLAPGAMSIKPWKKRFFLRAAKLMGLFRNAIFHATTEQEKQEIQRWIGKRKIITVPNLPPPIDSSEDPGISKKEGELRLISIARIAPEKNTLGLLELLADKGRSGVHLSLYGPIYDRAYWQKCQQVIERMPEGVSVTHSEGVHPEDAPAVIREHHAFILLTKGENYGHAILEALLAGRPAIISDRTPWDLIGEEGAGWVVGLEDREQQLDVLDELLFMGQDAFDRVRERVKGYAKRFKEQEELEAGYRSLFGKGD